MFRFALRLCRPYWGSLLLIAACIVVETAYVAVSPLSFQYLIDDAFPAKDAGLFALVLTLLVIGGAFYLGAGIVSDRRLAKVNEQAVYDLRAQLFRHIAGQSEDFHRRFDQGSLTNRLTSDVSAVDRTISGVLPRTFRELLALLIGLSLLFHLEWKLALAMIAGFVLLFASPYVLQRKAERSSERYREENDAYIGIIDEVLKGRRVVKGMNAAAYILGRVERRLASLQTAGIRVTFVYALLDRIPQSAFLALNAAMIGFGGTLIFQDQLSVGSFIAFFTIFLSAGQSVSSLSQVIPSLIEAGVSFRRIAEVLQYRSPLARPSEPKPFEGVREGFRFRDVAFGYDEHALALDGVTLAIPAGGMTAFVGQSGSGKSTALQLLLRFYDPKRGSIEVDGIDLRELSETDYRRHTGVVFQDSFLFNGTVYENISLSRPGVAESDVRAAAEAARIHELIERMPEGYATLVKDFGGNFSGGQRQRIAIARALIGSPRLLVLDEITSALDPSTEAEINELIESFRGERTIVTVTHRLASVTNADLIVVFRNGTVAETGTHRELLARGGLYAEMWEKQHGFVLSGDGFQAKVEGERLSRLPFFRGIPFEQLDSMSDRFVTEKYDAGHTVVRENDPGDKFYIIVRGRVSVEKAGVRVAVLEDGDYFGEIALLKDIPRTADIVTVKPTVLLSLRREQLLELTAAYPSIREVLERTLKERMK
ncbi:ABC transporter transmembrane domain-containing protein [Paenibacillus antri]|uniref:ABC transporter transmembrane domain-containing protein n=1 Tax=Paenibacillus antri TaxID=2582848 RepID=UPI001EE454F6|nr:ABC transporter transmembrane domain-containing protein [Paenibacillus antri]